MNMLINQRWEDMKGMQVSVALPKLLWGRGSIYPGDIPLILLDGM